MSHPLPSHPLPRGFRFAGVHCGIKQDASREDLTLVVADGPCVAAGVYTKNLIVAAPVEFDRRLTPSSDIRVVVINSGNANACTGEQGVKDAEAMAQLAATACDAGDDQTLIMSTGIIGELMPMGAISAGIAAAAEKLAANEESFLAASRGIMTTDKTQKIASREVTIGDQIVTITGMAKGAGMIGPRMATMLGLVMTDAALRVEDAQQLLTVVADESFNCISVEGHTSTNDTVVLLAGGAINPTPLTGDELATFSQSFREVCIQLAKSIPSDGEGATHLIEIDVEGCRADEDARQIARTIADSALVKTAVTGADPNWGRIVSAAGYAGIDFDPEKIELYLNGTLLFTKGGPVPFDAEAVSTSMRENHTTHFRICFAEGEQKARFWTSDLTHEYIHINADYHT